MRAGRRSRGTRAYPSSLPALAAISFRRASDTGMRRRDVLILSVLTVAQALARAPAPRSARSGSGHHVAACQCLTHDGRKWPLAQVDSMGMLECPDCGDPLAYTFTDTAGVGAWKLGDGFNTTPDTRHY